MTQLPTAKILTVTELTQQVKTALEGNFPAQWVAGEISGLARPGSGHVYFTLKDPGSQIGCVIYKNAAARIPYELVNGQEVIARGRLSVYVPRGNYQLLIDELQPKGMGAAELALRQLKEKLHKLGYFAQERKRPLPVYPRRVAVVTSPTGAAVRDILETLAKRWPLTEVWVCPTRVQGETAALEIARALLGAGTLAGADVVIVGRGGGSSEDLSAFNDERVAVAIFECPIPVVSAVGHEIDVTIADMVADARALTPTAAAQMIVPHQIEFQNFLEAFADRFRQALIKTWRLGAERLENLAERRCFRLPLEGIRERERRLDDLENRIQRAIKQQIERLQERVHARMASLEGLSPLNVLARGYSLTRREKDLTVVRLGSEVVKGSRLVTDVHRARIVSVVETIEPVDRSVVPRNPAAGLLPLDD